MSRVLFSFILLMCSVAVRAQGSFVQRVQSDVPGQGKIVIIQPDSIQSVVENGHAKSSSRTGNNANKTTSEKNKGEKASENGEKTSEEHTRTTPYIGGVKHKARGYRVQIYTGGNSRADKNAATSAGNRCRAAFPELSVYTHFSSPKWVCVVGDFKDTKQAQKYADAIRRARVSSEARVVPSEVYLSR